MPPKNAKKGQDKPPAAAMTAEEVAATEQSLRAQIMDLLASHPDGLSNEELQGLTERADSKMRTRIVNDLLEEDAIEMLAISLNLNEGFKLRLKKGSRLDRATAEEQLVFDIIEESGKMGIWIRDIRDKTGLKDAELRKILKTLETRRVIRSIKAAGTTRKSYILYDIEVDDSISGGTFYSDQQFDSEFVATLINVCVNMLQGRRRRAEESLKDDLLAQREASFARSEDVARYILEKKICTVQLGVGDVESILSVAVLDGKLEQRQDKAYRAVKVRHRPTALATVPCTYCPMRAECRPGHVISPEGCEYLKEYFEL